MNSKLKEIIAAGREPLPSSRQAKQRLSDIVERLEQAGGFSVEGLPQSEPERTLADDVRDFDNKTSLPYEAKARLIRHGGNLTRLELGVRY